MTSWFRVLFFAVVMARETAAAQPRCPSFVTQGEATLPYGPTRLPGPIYPHPPLKIIVIMITKLETPYKLHYLQSSFGGLDLALSQAWKLRGPEMDHAGMPSLVRNFAMRYYDAALAYYAAAYVFTVQCHGAVLTVAGHASLVRRQCTVLP